MNEMPIIMENVIFKRATVLPSSGEVKFIVTIAKQSGNFEIYEGGSVVVTGNIKTSRDISSEFVEVAEPSTPSNDYLPLTKDDMYKECHLRRYTYTGYFQGITEADVYGTRGRLEWKEKFDSFLDTMLHLSILTEHSRDLILPTYIQQVVIDPQSHLKLVNESKGKSNKFREVSPIFSR